MELYTRDVVVPTMLIIDPLSALFPRMDTTGLFNANTFVETCNNLLESISPTIFKATGASPLKLLALIFTIDPWLCFGDAITLIILELSLALSSKLIFNKLPSIIFFERKETMVEFTC